MNVDPAVPESHREVLIVPFQDHPDNGILHNGFGIEIIGADFNHYRAGLYRGWLRTANKVVIQLPTGRSTLTRFNDAYQRERARLGGHSEAYELARMVVRNRILGNRNCQTYNLELVFPIQRRQLVKSTQSIKKKKKFHRRPQYGHLQILSGGIGLSLAFAAARASRSRAGGFVKMNL